MEIKEISQAKFCQRSAGFLHRGESTFHWVLLYAHQGVLHAVVEGYDLKVNPEQFLLCAPEQFHMLYTREDCSYVTLLFDARELPTSLSGKVLPGTDILKHLAQELQQPDGFSQDIMLHLLSLAMLQLCRETQNAPALPPVSYKRGENDIIRRAQQYISAHIREKLSVTLVAARVDVSPSYMTALFHKHLAISPGDYIRRAKLQESKRLIREGKLNFTEIASALEYSTVHHFSRQFKENFGMTPTEYARSVGTKGV